MNPVSMTPSVYSPFFWAMGRRSVISQNVTSPLCVLLITNGKRIRYPETSMCVSVFELRQLTGLPSHRRTNIGSGALIGMTVDWTQESNENHAITMNAKLLFPSDHNYFSLKNDHSNWIWIYIEVLMDSPNGEESINDYLQKRCITIDQLKEITKRNSNAKITWYFKGICNV